MEKTRNVLSTKKALMAGAAIITLSAGVGFEAEAATGTGAISAVLLTPIVVSGTQVLHFGDFTADTAGTGGVITVSSAGVRSETSAGIALVTGLGAEQEGIIQVTGEASVAIDLSVPAGTVGDTRDGVTITDGYAIVHSTNVAQTMVVGNFIVGITASGAGFGTNDNVTVTLPTATPTDNINLGAQLLVKNTNIAGTYTGTYDLDASYQ